MGLLKMTRILGRTYPIFNTADRPMNTSLQKSPALYDHSMPVADDWLHIGNSRNSLILLVKLDIYK